MTATERAFSSQRTYGADEVCTMIGSLQAEPPLIGSCCVRSVSLRTVKNGVVPLTTILRFDKDSVPLASRPSQPMSVGAIELNVETLDAGVPSTKARLSSIIWHSGSRPPGVMVQQYMAHRYPSRTAWGESPGWYIETGSYSPGVPLPTGPFLVRQSNLLFNTVPALAAWWTGEVHIEPTSRFLHGLVVPDYRAYFKRITVGESSFRIEVMRSESTPLIAVLVGRDLFGREVLHHQEIEGDAGVIELSRVLTSVRFFLMGQDEAEWLDMHIEPHFAARSGDVLIGPDAVQRHQSLRLEEQLLQGEGPQTEFKAWIDPGKNKHRELHECLVAFANGGGGSLLIGVNDYGEVVGTDRPLQDLMKSGATNSARDRYAQRLRESVLNSVKPRLLPEFRWYERGSAWILEVSVAARPGERYFVESTKEVFVRRGATNERLTPWDAAAAMRPGRA